MIRTHCGSWKDMAYEAIPKQRWALRVFWHICRLHEEAVAAQVQLSAEDAASRARLLVKEEDLGEVALPLGAGIA